VSLELFGTALTWAVALTVLAVKSNNQEAPTLPPPQTSEIFSQIALVLDPVTQRFHFDFCQRGVLSSTTERRHFQIFHLVLHKAEQRAGVGLAWNNRGLTALAASEEAREVSKKRTRFS
jgi:hypothetical protein